MHKDGSGSRRHGRSLFYTIVCHLAVISGLIMFVILILDWYNPFMNFMGHATLVQVVLCASAIILGAGEVMAKAPMTRRGARRKQ